MPGFNVSRDHSGEAWFRLGRLDVTTTVLLVLAGAVGLVLSAFVPDLVSAGAFVPQRVLTGEIWRMATWPFFDRISLWPVIALALLWYFGRDLEARLGRAAMAALYVGLWATLTVVNFVLGVALGGGAMVGLGEVQFLILLLWIAEYPRRPFFFGIPAWVVGAVLVGIQVLGTILVRDLAGLLSLAVTAVVTVFLARGLGLLSDLSWLPGRRGGTRRHPRLKASRRGAKPSRSEHRAARHASDSERMDALLEKISAEGIHSLTKAERKELDALRERRRRGR